MPAPPRPLNEVQRVSALQRYGLLEGPAGEDLDFLTEMAALVCGTPSAFVVLVDAEQAWVKSAFGAAVPAPRPRDDDYCGWTLLEPEGLHVADLLADARMAALTPTREIGWRMYSGVNLRTQDGHAIGTLCVLDKRPRELSAQQQRMLRQLGRQVMSLIELRATQRELQASLRALDRLTREDELTGLLNRRALMQALETEAARQQRYGGELSIVLFDIDHFKRINDQHGHPLGDEVLRRVGALVRDSVRAVDTAGRYGGEEFLLVLPATSEAGAQALAELLRLRLAEMSCPAPVAQVTASFGVAAVAPELEGLQDAIAAADAAMYRAKQFGRNRVEVSRA